MRSLLEEYGGLIITVVMFIGIIASFQMVFGQAASGMFEEYLSSVM